jgi:hypothetical protein
MGRYRGVRVVTSRRLNCFALALVSTTLALDSARPAAAQDDAPAIVRAAVAAYAAEHRGTIAFSRHLNFSLRVGPMSQVVRNEIGVLMRDGAMVRTKYYSAETNGKSDDLSKLRQEEERANDELASGRSFFKRPVDSRYAADYRFEPATCDGCEHGVEAVKFTSLERDAEHGDGTMTIDRASSRVLTIEYTVNRPPQHASVERVVETFGDALPDLWTCVRVEQTTAASVSSAVLRRSVTRSITSAGSSSSPPASRR